MYIDTRRTSACQSVASASRDLALTQLAYHCKPCVLMPRNWIGWLYWLHRCTPQTCSCPLIAAGVSPGPGGAVVGGVVGPGWPVTSALSLSMLGPPSVVMAVARIRFSPPFSGARTVTSFQVVQAPVPGKARLLATITPSTLICSDRLPVVPLAYRKTRSVPSDPLTAGTVHST